MKRRRRMGDPDSMTAVAGDWLLVSDGVGYPQAANHYCNRNATNFAFGFAARWGVKSQA